MKKFTLEINLGNDSMQTAEDVCDALADVSTDIRNNPTLDSWVILDDNGNKVGRWWFE